MIITSCNKCILHRYRRHVVLGRIWGAFPVDICLIGEAPGQTEDMMGEAFVGKAGRLLDSMIDDAANNTNTKPSIYFTNTVLCRPCDCTGGSNRQPTSEEIFICSENVNFIIGKTEAKHFILCGETAEKYMKKRVPHYTKIMHPAAILRHGGKSSGFYMQTVRILESLFMEVYK